MDEATIKNMSDEEFVNLFIEGLIEEKGIKTESEELKADIFADLKTRLMQEIDKSLIMELPEEKLEELSKTAREDGRIDADEVAKAIEEAGLNTGEIIAVTMGKFREVYLGEGEEEIKEEDTEE